MTSTQTTTILVVEDDAYIRTAVTMLLRNTGYQVVSVASGEDALSIASRADLILMDIELGYGIDGVEAAGLILEVRDVPIVFRSNTVDPDTIRRARAIAGEFLLTKTDDDLKLLSCVQSALSVRADSI